MKDKFFDAGERRVLDAGYLSGGAGLSGINSLLNNHDQAIYIFGAGIFGMDTRDFLAGLPGIGERICGYLDSNPAKWGTLITDLPVFCPEDQAVRESNPFVVLACFRKDHEAEMRLTCQLSGYACLPCGYFFYSRDHDSITAAYDVWAEDESRQLYRELVRHMFAPTVRS